MMKLSLGMGKIVSIVKVTTDKNAKIANSSVTSYAVKMRFRAVMQKLIAGMRDICGNA